MHLRLMKYAPLMTYEFFMRKTCFRPIKFWLEAVFKCQKEWLLRADVLRWEHPLMGLRYIRRVR